MSSHFGPFLGHHDQIIFMKVSHWLVILVIFGVIMSTQKYSEYFHKISSQKGLEPLSPIHPHQGEKMFYAFLDELYHFFFNKNKSVIFTLDSPLQRYKKCLFKYYIILYFILPNVIRPLCGTAKLDIST